MLKENVNIKNGIYYSPAHNTFFRLEIPDDIILKISGHEERIFEFLLNKPNQPVKKETIESAFPECPDPYNKTLDRFRREKFEKRLQLYDVIIKTNGSVTLYLKESPFESSINETEKLLLCRTNFFIDYDMILSEFSEKNSQSVLSDWTVKCQSLSSYDEKGIFLLERLAFIPTLGNIEEKLKFISDVRKLMYRYEKTDIHKYGNTYLLDFLRSLIYCVIDYLEFKITKNTLNEDSERELKQLINKFNGMISVSDNYEINPLILLVYYDYLGLAYYTHYKITHNNKELLLATTSLENAIEYTNKVDMHLKVWKAFVTFNLARIYEELEESDKAIRNYNTAVALRKCLTESPFFSDNMKHDLYFEYLLAKIYYIDAILKYGDISNSEAQKEYALINEEFKKYYFEDNRGGNQKIIEQMLVKRI